MTVTIKKMECLPEENLPSFLEDKNVQGRTECQANSIFYIEGSVNWIKR